MGNFKLNDRVLVAGKNTRGKIAFIGETRFADGQMFGVILDEPKSKYNGTIDNVCYFECPMKHGTFVRACQLEKDCGHTLEDCNRPAYPNYLKESRSKLGVKTQKQSSAIGNSCKNKLKTSESVDLVYLREKQIKNECNKIAVVPNRLTESDSKREFENQANIKKIENGKQNLETSDSTTLDISMNKKIEKSNRQANQNVLKKNDKQRPQNDIEIRKKELVKTTGKHNVSNVDLLNDKQPINENHNKPKHQNILKRSRSFHLIPAKKESTKSEDIKRIIKKNSKHGPQNEIEIPEKENSETTVKCKTSNAYSLNDQQSINEADNKLKHHNILTTKSQSTHVITAKVETPKAKDIITVKERSFKNGHQNEIEKETILKCPESSADILNDKQSLKEDRHNTKQTYLLKGSRSSHVIPSKVRTPKPEDIATNLNILDMGNSTASRNNLPQDEVFQKGDAITNSLSCDKKEENCTDEDLIMNEIISSKQKISDQEQQMIALRRYLKMLTTYIKWNDECEKSPETADDQIKNVSILLIDNAIQKIENILSLKPGGKEFDAIKENESVLEEENNFLLLTISKLEKRNAVLTDNLTSVKNILERAWKRSKSKKRLYTKPNNRKGHSEDRSDAKSFTDIIEQESRQFVKSNPSKITTPAPSMILEKLNGQERIKKYLQSLSEEKDTKNGYQILGLDTTRDQHNMHCSKEPNSSSEGQQLNKTKISKGQVIRPNVVSITKQNIDARNQKNCLLK